MADKAKNKRFPYYIFFIFFFALLLMSGVHTGFVVLVTGHNYPMAIQVVTPVLYWALMAAVLTSYTRYAIKKSYEKPIQDVSEATEKIAKGDFSVRLPSIRYSGAADYLDSMVEDFNKMAEELKGVETLRTDFIANVSHELKTPLAVMQNYGTMLQQPDLSEEDRVKYAKIITDASRRLSDLIANILKLNKLENQQIYPMEQTYDLSEQLCECLLMFEEAWEKKNIEIQTDIEENIMIETDPELLSLVWNNLFSNAIKFTEPMGTVSLSVKSEDGFAVVKVSDTGCGMSREVGEHIFEKFYQGDTSHSTQGNGLGLALVKRIIDIVNGEISVTSEAGKGSTFMVRLRGKTNGEIQTDM